VRRGKGGGERGERGRAREWEAESLLGERWEEEDEQDKEGEDAKEEGGRGEGSKGAEGEGSHTDSFGVLGGAFVNLIQNDEYRNLRKHFHESFYLFWFDASRARVDHVPKKILQKNQKRQFKI
jgi:hypothetical protein